MKNGNRREAVDLRSPPASDEVTLGAPNHFMTTQEIQQTIDAAIRANFEGITSESGEMMTSAGGDGRFLGKVIATRYAGLPAGKDIFVAIGQTELEVQIVKVGKSECLKPDAAELDFMLRKELGIAIDG